MVQQNQNSFDDVLLNINIDDAGYKEGKSAFSLMELPEEIKDVAQKVIENNPAIIEGTPWYQGDHSIFLQYGRPAIAVSSSWFLENLETQDITHTPKDNLSIVNYERIVEIAMAIKELLEGLNQLK